MQLAIIVALRGRISDADLESVTERIYYFFQGLETSAKAIRQYLGHLDKNKSPRTNQKQLKLTSSRRGMGNAGGKRRRVYTWTTEKAKKPKDQEDLGPI